MPKGWRLVQGEVSKLLPEKCEDSMEVVVFEREIEGEKKSRKESSPSEKEMSKEQNVIIKVIIFREKSLFWDPMKGEQSERREGRPLHIGFLAESSSKPITSDRGVDVYKVKLGNWLRNFEKFRSYEATGNFKANHVRAHISSDTIGEEFCAYPTGVMREWVVNDLFEFLVKNKYLSEIEGRYFQALCGHKETPKGEIYLTNHVKKLLDKMFVNKKEVKQSELQSDIESTICFVKAIHLYAIDENRRNNRTAFASSSDREIALDDADAAFNLGEALIPVSADYACKAFELLTEASFLYNEAQSKIAHHKIHLTMMDRKDISEKQLRQEREQALSQLIRAESRVGGTASQFLPLFLTLLELHCGFDFKRSTDMFKDFKDGKIDKDEPFAFIFAMSNKLYEYNKSIAPAMLSSGKPGPAVGSAKPGVVVSMGPASFVSPAPAPSPAPSLTFVYAGNHGSTMTAGSVVAATSEVSSAPVSMAPSSAAPAGAGPSPGRSLAKPSKPARSLEEESDEDEPVVPGRHAFT